MVDVNDAVVAVAAFLGGFAGQAVRAGRLEPQLAALRDRVLKLEGYASIVRRYCSRVHQRLAHLERAQESGR